MIRRIEDGSAPTNPDWPRADGRVGRERPRRSAGVDRRPAAADDSSAARSTTCWTTVRSSPPATRRRRITTEFTVDVKPPKITAVRLELLNDPNLPHGGPGRSIYGTCALTEFEVEAAPLDKPDKTDELEIRQGDRRRESAGARAGQGLRRPQRQAARHRADRICHRRQRC